jgi:S1-C subfamily serine protease
MRSADDLARCVVMLDRPFTETITVDGRDFEVWLKPLGGGRAMPKLDRHLGTGFLVASDAAVYVVTAAHVARRMDREARVSYTGRRGARTALALTDLLAAASPKQVWTFHRTADVAVARLRPHPQLRGRCLPAELLAASASAPSGSLELVTVGFPLGLASERHFAPISKRARAASTVVRFRGEEMEQPADFFLLDQPVVGGYSGAPLFVAPQTRVTEGGRLATVTARCVGLLSQTIALEGIGQFTAVVPSRVIRRLLRGR